MSQPQSKRLNRRCWFFIWSFGFELIWGAFPVSQMTVLVPCQDLEAIFAPSRLWCHFPLWRHNPWDWHSPDFTCWAPSDFSQVATHNEGSRSLDPFKDWAKLYYAANFQQQYDAVKGDPGYISLAFFGQVAFIFIGDGPERLCLWVEFLDLGDKYVIWFVSQWLSRLSRLSALHRFATQLQSDFRWTEAFRGWAGRPWMYDWAATWVPMSSLHWYLNLANPLTDHAAKKKCSISRDSEWTLKRWSNFLKESVAQISSGPRLVGTISRSAVDSGGFS